MRVRPHDEKEKHEVKKFCPSGKELEDLKQQKLNQTNMKADVTNSNKTISEVSKSTKMKVVKKKKKQSFKSMMKGIVKTKKHNFICIKKERDALHKVTGGGKFLKVDKI